MGARYPYQNTTKDGSGKIICSATVAVFLTGTSTPASIYIASAGGVAVNSVTSGADTSSAPGYFIFWVDRSDYTADQEFDITISKSGFNTQTYSFIVIDNAADYPLLLGRSGGQIQYGGTDSGDDLTLYSTSHATKGHIRTSDKVEITSDIGGWVSDARALLYVAKDVGLASGEIDYTALFLTKSKGDNATFIGSSAIEVHAQDRVDVTALNKGVLFGIQIYTHLLADRDNTPFDDVACLTLSTSSNYKGTDCLYIGHFASWVPATNEWYTGLNIDAWCDQAIALKGHANFGVNMDNITLATVSGNKQALTLPDGAVVSVVAGGGYQPLILGSSGNVGIANGLPTGKNLQLAPNSTDANVVYIHVAGADALITAGADDSGGAGYKVLRVPN